MGAKYKEFIKELQVGLFSKENIIKFSGIGTVEKAPTGNLEIFEDEGKFYFNAGNGRTELTEDNFETFLDFLKEKSDSNPKSFRVIHLE